MKLSSELVYGLIASILLVSAPHAEHLPLWISIVAALLLAWRTYLNVSSKPLPPRWLLFTIALAGSVGIFISFKTLVGREPGVALLIFLVTLKLLETRAIRDGTVLIYLSSFIIITNFFYSQSIATAVFMLLTLLVITATWVHMHTGALVLKVRLKISSLLLLQAIPLTLLLFILFPRVQGPLWGLPQNAYAESGLSDSMSPGSMSKLSLSEEVAFRVVFKDNIAPFREQMYWRGPVLWDYDGRTWTDKDSRNGMARQGKVPQIDALDIPVDYTVTLEPHNKRWLFALELPTHVSIPSRFSADFQLLSIKPVNSRLRYDAHSQLSYNANVEELPYQLQRALNLPPNLNPKTIELARQWRKEMTDDAAIMQAALLYFSREKFVYTLEPPLLSDNAMDDFLFESRKGFCEHYASSFVFLMRAAGIPARVITGYQGGQFNALGGYYIVRQSDAHAWAEVWFKERGWIRVDPTAAIAPTRIQSGLNQALPDNAALPFLARTQSPFLMQLRFNLDAFTNQWNQWVLGYDTERQFAFLTRMGMEDISWQKMALNMLMGISVLVAIFALLMLRHLYTRPQDKVQNMYLRFCRKLARAGLVRATHEGPQDFATRASSALPHHASKISRITALYLNARYAEQNDTQNLHALRHEIASFKL